MQTILQSEKEWDLGEIAGQQSVAKRQFYGSNLAFWGIATTIKRRKHLQIWRDDFLVNRPFFIKFYAMAMETTARRIIVIAAA